jgi:hypothetical protein
VVYFLSGFNMVIRFRPGHLKTKPDALTHWPDLYPEGEEKPYDSDNSKYLCWSVNNVGFVRINQRILVPESKDLWLCILQSFHNHPVSGHFCVNKILSVI